ncbi:MAG: DUF3043 domain-containing protein [Candidatus Nanopelagicales bacterium]|nr:DUF3043 domain-containing protein [Candidatus Nanopelagicales bacterium]
MFGKKQDPQPAPTPSQATADAGKGRPTPSRREAEAARKNRAKVPSDPKAAKKAARERARVDRERQRQGMIAGDERYMAKRDQGPARAFTRDFVDARFTLAEYFIIVAVGVLVMGFIPVQALQFWVTVAFFAFTALLVIDTIIMVAMLNRQATKVFPNPQDRKGLTLYAILRVMQLRRLRLPPARVRRGGAPK